MSAPRPIADLTTKEVILSLYIVERDRDRLELRRAQIMAAIAERLPARSNDQPPITPPAP